MKFTAIRVSGADRASFLQGQLTQDVHRLETVPALPAAWCNPKGRVIVTLRLVASADSVLLFMPSDSVEAVLKRLTMYKLRADVSLTIAEDVQCHGFATADDDERPLGERVQVEHGTTSVQYAGLTEVFGTEDQLGRASIAIDEALSEEDWSARRIGALAVDISMSNREQFTPHMLGLDRAGAVSFSKGCYTGQEIVARTEHLGSVKRSLQCYRFDGAAPPEGASLSHAGNEVGRIVNSAKHVALAVVPIELHADTLKSEAGDAVPCSG